MTVIDCGRVMRARTRRGDGILAVLPRPLLALASVTCAIVLGAASPASAARVDVASEHVGQHALERYLAAMVANLPAGQKEAQTLVSSVSATCPNALAAGNLLQITPAVKATAEAFGGEAAADVALESLVPDRAPLEALSARMSRLHWSSRRSSAAISKTLVEMRRFYTLTPSNLCADAAAVASDGWQAPPPATLAFLAAFGHPEIMGFSGMVHVLERFQTSADRGVVASINRLSHQESSGWVPLVTGEQRQVLIALGLSV